MTAMPRHSDTPRRTRSASCRLRRSSSNHTTSECCFCPDPELFDGEEIKSELIGPFVNRKGQAKLFVHFDCACWAPQVFADAQSGQLRGVYDEYCRGRKLKCSDCGGRGATIGCYVQRCKHVFHFRCLPRSGARRVERFFVAFCANHAHLGEKQSYKILMEAATIADVAEAHRRQDTTFGLDAPHSRYTQLRRRETELIFSRKFGICSHAGAFETNKVIFSHKRRKILGKTDRLLLTEQPRALLTSAFDVASGRLAYMSVAGNDKVDNMTAVEARAALASREKSTLFLLRNLRRAPTWSKHNMTVVKKSGSDAAPPAEPASAIQHEPRSPALSKLGRQGEESPAGEGDSIHECNDHVQLPCHLDEGDKTGTDPSGERRSKRRRISTGARLENDDQEVKADVSDGQLQSAPLPAFKKTLRTAEAESLLAPVEHTTPVSGGGEQVSADMELLKDSPTSKASPDRAAAKKSNGSPSRDKKRKLGGLPPNLVASSRQGLAGKVKSAWETFLEEQLPKERILRPDDSEVEAMRNMARLWSLLSVEARESYEERARQAGLSGCDAVNGMNTADKASLRPLKRPKLSNRLPKRLPDQAVGPRADDPGLFVSSDRAPSSSTNIEVCETAVKKGVGKRQLSVSLPRRSWTSRVSLPGMELLAVEWDDVLPTSLGPDAANTDTDTEKVRRPPPRNKKM
ncbi:unnamed protein product [Chondrus crispus]|uniref:PHD-type domain-containing protein n=1 Tax=Chondrus crispus TaxID=2769 RepID=R7QJZ8_CHOCR|nr:unnamed protein product [Chondrus crispus]CDF38847.1 unnamed protein product [Chondrus crispus]|eukprot:XP_005718752.1 unnamed protein product [Chondrus crispus]